MNGLPRKVLLRNSSISSAGDAGEVGTGQAGDSARAGSGGDAGLADGSDDADDAGAGRAGGPTVPCQKLGTELCNGGDDDCNGTIDDDCAYTVAWTQAAQGAILGHETGGVTFLEPCPDGSVLTGLQVGMGRWLNQVSAICRQISLVADTSGADVAFSVSLGARVNTSLVPAETKDSVNKIQDLVCPSGLLLSGVDGTVAPESDHYTRGIRITCALPSVESTDDGPVLGYDRSDPQGVGPIVCSTCSATQAETYTFAIAPGHIASGLFGAAGLWDDRVGFFESVGSIALR